MSECVVRMEMPRVCITDNGYYGYCPMDRIWCIQRNAPPNITMREAYEAMTDKIPSWCPIICSLPEGHGRLVDMRDIESMMENAQSTSDESGMYSLVYRDDLDFEKLHTIVPAERSKE